MQKLDSPQKWYDGTSNLFDNPTGPLWLSMRDLG